MRAWAHLHLPRLRSKQTADVISLKVPGWAIEYVSHVEMQGVEFKVHEKGRQRCIREAVRNVHAWVVGEVTLQEYGPGYDVHLDKDRWRKAVYDPFKGGTFVDSETLEPVTIAFRACLIGKDVFYEGYETRYGRCYCRMRDWQGDMPPNHSVMVCSSY